MEGPRPAFDTSKRAPGDKKKKHTNLKSARKEIKELKSELAIKNEFVQVAKEKIAIQDKRSAVLTRMQKDLTELKTTAGLTTGEGVQGRLTELLNENQVNEQVIAMLREQIDANNKEMEEILAAE
ncbi:hypothetical protein LTR37_000472 [Vermiconidia calcicola]|uniref:Uncharacterized protein n=1 Tax=Vermiconidia calcicola TaxID=1690605 RepID=A0ACC3NZH9_9PEZI|nr:hypothetical protein LTR37_000472 [Vermiconidia calcicola]